MDETVRDESGEYSGRAQVWGPELPEVPARPKDGPFSKSDGGRQEFEVRDREDKPSEKEPEYMCIICGANPVEEEGGVCDNHNFETDDDTEADEEES